MLVLDLYLPFSPLISVFSLYWSSSPSVLLFTVVLPLTLTFVFDLVSPSESVSTFDFVFIGNPLSHAVQSSQEMMQDVVQSNESLPAWFALRVRSNHERTTSKSLQQKGYDEFTPFYRTKRRWSDRTREMEFPLFPGYVYCRFDPKLRLPILQTPGVVSVVSFGNEPAPIDEEEIANIKSVVERRPAAPWPF